MEQDRSHHSSSMNDNSNTNAEKDSSSNDDIAAEKDSSSSSNDDSGLSTELSSMTIDSISSKKKKKNTCLCCLKEVEGSKRCSRCETASYCGEECQAKHWPVHKNSCRDSNDTENSDEKLDMKAKNHYNQGNFIHIYVYQ